MGWNVVVQAAQVRRTRCLCQSLAQIQQLLLQPFNLHRLPVNHMVQCVYGVLHKRQFDLKLFDVLLPC